MKLEVIDIKKIPILLQVINVRYIDVFTMSDKVCRYIHVSRDMNALEYLNV